ncbi:hypothetical protein Tco_1475245 [Tanacetum coccineum]
MTGVEEAPVSMFQVGSGNVIVLNALAEKLAKTGRRRELVRVNLGYRVAVGGGPNTWPVVVQVGSWIRPELDDPSSKEGVA